MRIKWPWLFKTILKKYAAITIFPFIFTKEEVTDKVMLHEKVHLMQQIRFAIVFFYIAYIAQYIFYRIKYRDHNNVAVLYINQTTPSDQKGRLLCWSGNRLRI